MFAPQMALWPEYDQQSIQQDYLISQSTKKYPDKDGGGLKWKKRG